MSKLGAQPTSDAQPQGPELLRGDRCRCPSCGERFNSTKAFDQHRVGWFAGLSDMPTRRWCLIPTEMSARGMKRGRYGWLTRRGRR
jgi:hypothetical protein